MITHILRGLTLALVVASLCWPVLAAPRMSGSSLPTGTMDGDYVRYNGSSWAASTLTIGDMPLAVVKTTGSYADPSWLTSLAKSKVSLGNVENTALSTWAGSANITTVGALAMGSIATGFGNIQTAGTLQTGAATVSSLVSSGAMSGTTGTFSDLLTVTKTGASIQDVGLLVNAQAAAADTGAALAFRGADASKYLAAIKTGWIDDTTNNGAYLSLWTRLNDASQATEKFRISPVGTLTSLTANPANVNTAGAGILGGGIAFTDVANAWIDDSTHGNGSVTMYIGTYSIDVTAPSDMRVKRDIRPTKVNALALLNRIQMKDYFWRDPKMGTGEQFGWTAQQVHSVIPDVVLTPAKEAWRVQNHKLVPYAVLAIQELASRSVALEAKVTALEAEKATLVKRFDKLEARLAALDGVPSGTIRKPQLAPAPVAKSTAKPKLAKKKKLS